MQRTDPPPLVHAAVSQACAESNALLDAAAQMQANQQYVHSVALLERAHASLLHWGKIADLQVCHHGLPAPRTMPLGAGGLAAAAPTPMPMSRLDSDVQALTQMLFAAHFDPAWTRTLLRDLSATSTARPSSARDGADTSPGDAPRAVHAASQAIADTAASTRTDGEDLTAASDAVAGGVRPSRSKWTSPEITLFEEGLRLYGARAPAMIARHMGTRTNEQVRERIRRLRPGGKATPSGAAAGASQLSAMHTLGSGCDAVPGGASLSEGHDTAPQDAGASLGHVLGYADTTEHAHISMDGMSHAVEHVL